MKAAFYNVHKFHGENHYETYVKDLATAKKSIWVSEADGYKHGYIAKYVDMGSCYLLDLEWGDNGMIDWEVENGIIVFQSQNAWSNDNDIEMYDESTRKAYKTAFDI